ncbi:MAG: Holliday junction branch migration protein RuvA [Clostridia bacterium]
MIYSLTGRVEFYEEGRVVINCNDVGFEVAVSNNTLVKCVNSQDCVTLLTYLQVTDDALRLFGFFSKEERNMFLKLITISGVGAKVALQVLSGIDLTSLALSIVNGDVTALTRIKGIGKKTAERIILELKEKVDITGLQNSLAGSVDMTQILNDEVSNDAVMALASLGIGKTEAVKAVAAARIQSDKLEKIITLALRSFDK